MAAANFSLGDSEKVQYTLVELDAASNPVAGNPSDTISVTSGDPASITVEPDATPVAGSVASGWLVGGNKIQNGVVISATVTHADGTSLSTTDILDLVGGVASSLSFGLGAPVAK